jgi:hypothetical protein
MKDKQTGNGKAKATRARELPVEEFARLVDSLDAASIESACAQDGAEPGGLPPGWADGAASIALVMGRLREEGCSIPENEPSSLAADWDGAWPVAKTIVARGEALAGFGIHDGDTLDVDPDSEPAEGDIVAANLPGMGRLLRQLRFVGGAALLCSSNPERPAIPVDPTYVPTLRTVRIAQ